MKIHTNDFKNELIKFGREIDCIISYELNGETIELGAAELNTITSHYEGSILKSVMKQLDIETNVEIPKETVLNCQFGLKVNGEYEYLNFGNYVVYNVEKQEDTKDYKIICYDKILYSMKPYENMNITYPITIRNYINQICNKLGLTFKNINDEFANYDREINVELYLDSEGNDLGYTFRDVLDELAQATASTICINETTDELEIRYINNTNDLIDEYYLKDVNVKFGEKYGPINSIVLSRSADSDNVYLRDDESIEENGLCEIKIKDNQIMNFNNRSDYLPDILEKLDGLEYYINDFSSVGIAYYNLCDRYNVSIDNNVYSCIMFNDEFKITQGLEEIIHTELPEESETDYTKADKTDRKINQTYLIVDKQNQTIQSLVSEVGDYSDRISTVEQDVESISQTVRDFEDLVRENTSREKVFVENAMAGKVQYLSITGKFELLYPDENSYPASYIYPLKPYLVVEKIPEEGEEIERKIYTLPFNKLNVGEKFEIDETGKCTLTKQDESVEDLGTLNVELYEGDNYVYITSNYPELLNYNIKFIIKNDYSDLFVTHVEMNSAITQTADEINLEVSKKVGNDEFGTKIIQNWDSVQIAWNNISQYIKFEGINQNALIRIYNENNVALSEFSKDGIWYMDNTSQIGKVGVSYSGSNKNLAFLAKEAAGMVWAKHSSGTTYSSIFRYNKNNDRLNFYVPLIDDRDHKVVGSTNIDYIYISPNNHFYMRGSDQHDYWIPTDLGGSDGRLKKNIVSADTNALNEILKINHRQFDWKKDEKHQNIGYIAQELEQIEPNWIDKVPKYDDDNNVIDEIYRIDSFGILPYITKSIQELYSIIENQQKQISTLLKNSGIDITEEKTETNIKRTKSNNQEIDYGEINEVELGVKEVKAPTFILEDGFLIEQDVEEKEDEK